MEAIRHRTSKSSVDVLEVLGLKLGIGINLNYKTSLLKKFIFV